MTILYLTGGTEDHDAAEVTIPDNDLKGNHKVDFWKVQTHKVVLIAKEFHLMPSQTQNWEK